MPIYCTQYSSNYSVRLFITIQGHETPTYKGSDMFTLICFFPTYVIIFKVYLSKYVIGLHVQTRIPNMVIRAAVTELLCNLVQLSFHNSKCAI